MQRLSVIFSLFTLLAFLSACGNEAPTPEPGSPGSTAISGTLMAPQGGDIVGALVYACYQGNCQDARGQTVTLTQAGPSGSFSIAGLESGVSYTLYASKDANGNGVLDGGDYSGGGSAVTAPAQGITISMTIMGGDPSTPTPDPTVPTDPTNPDPTNPDPTNPSAPTISGTLSAGIAGNVSGAVVVACTQSACPGQVQINGGGSSASFTLTGLTAGTSYQVFGWKDANGNGQVDNPGVDYYTDPLQVSAPAANVTLSFTSGPGGAPSDPTDPTTPSDPTVPDPTSPDPSDPSGQVTGTWTGSLTTQEGATSTMTMPLQQSGANVSGSLTLDGFINGTLQMSGTLSGTTLTLFGNGSGFQLTATVSGNTMSGSGTVDGGGQTISFTFTLTRGGNPDPTNPDPSDPTNPGPGESGTVSGTLSAPAGGDIRGTLIFFCTSQSCTPLGEVSESGQSTPFRIQGFTDGESFDMAAWKDVDNSGTVTAGDYLSQFVPVTVPATNVNLTMSVASARGAMSTRLPAVQGPVFSPYQFSTSR